MFGENEIFMTNDSLKLSRNQEDRAAALHEKSIVISALDQLSKNGYANTQGYFLKMKNGGVTAQNMTIVFPENGFYESMKGIYEWNDILSKNSDLTMRIYSVDDIKKAKEQKKDGIFYGYQGASAIEYDANLLSLFQKLGLRVMGITYQRRNRLGDGCGERTDSGLSKFGLEVVDQMNKLGIVVDLVHAGKRTSLETIEFSKDPVIFSHTNVYSLCKFDYNATDEVIQAMAEKGGAICVAPVSQYLRSDGAMKGSTIDDYLDHIEYAGKLVGVDHVAMGLDLFEDEVMDESIYSDRVWPEMFNRPYVFEKKHPTGFQSVAEVPNVTRGLVAREFSDQEIRKIIGGNLLKLFERVWKS
jgi:membrane dipeptidase